MKSFIVGMELRRMWRELTSAAKYHGLPSCQCTVFLCDYNYVIGIRQIFWMQSHKDKPLHLVSDFNMKTVEYIFIFIKHFENLIQSIKILFQINRILCY